MINSRIAGFLILTFVVIMVCIKIYKWYDKRKIVRRITSLSRGESSERDLIYRLVKSGIPETTIFHDLYLPSKYGYTQVDLVVPTNVGIFVFEVKDYAGWIFGNADNNRWTQILAYGLERHQFYNPIKQNEGHIKALRNLSEQLKNIPMYSIIVFYGSSEIRELSNVPSDCWVEYPRAVSKLVKNILASSEPAPFTDKWEIMRILKSAVDNGENEEIRAEHLQKTKRASYGKYRSTYYYRPSLFRFFRRRF